MATLFAVITISTIVLFVDLEISSVFLLSALVGFFSVGPAPATNLLVMERSSKPMWAHMFSHIWLMTSIGIVLALLVGFVWLAAFVDPQSLATVSIAFAIASIALSLKFLKDVPQGAAYAFRPTREAIAAFVPSLVERLNRVPVMFLKVEPYMLSPSRIRDRIATVLVLSPLEPQKKGKEENHKAPSSARPRLLFFATVGFFFIAGNLVFASYIPFLRENRVSNAEVFLIYALFHLSRVFVIPLNERLIDHSMQKTPEGLRWARIQRANQIAYVPRIFGIVLILIASILFAVEGPLGSHTMLFAASAIGFVALGTGFSLWQTTNSASLLRLVPQEHGRGAMLGLNSSITAAGLLFGALIAGALAGMYGYAATFGLSAIVLVISFITLSRFHNAMQQ